jgi:RHS repeat-associated protein
VGNNLNTTTYSYNERGWLTNLSNNSVGFSETLKYNIPEIGTTAQYNGNIANQLYTNGASNIFSYAYDKLNRLTNSTATGLGEQISYDVMGNITQMVREGYGTNNYTGYNGNQLTAISGFTNGGYTYDVNGNVKTGPDGLSLSYNYLNLPDTATKTSTGLSSSYVYDATGQKLKKLSNLDGTSDYVSGIHYENNSIAFIQTEEGRALAAGGGNYNYQYNLSDHLGNVRASFWRNPNSQSLEVVQQDNYYAFGLRKAVTSISPDNKYLYNGKELQKGLDQLDYGARFYDPVIARWNVVDNSAESYYRHSPYSYGINNPINTIDPDGNDIYLLIWFSKDGETGHAGIAIDNYKTEEVKDRNGKTRLDKNGNPVTKQVKDGTYTYYDLWPEKPVGQTELQSNVKEDYNGKAVNSLSELINTDVSASREAGKVSVNGEGRAADGIVKIGTNYGQDSRVKSKLSSLQASGQDYNGCYNNCSTFVQNGLRALAPTFDVSQQIRPSGALRALYNDARTVAPNNLYNGALRIKGAERVKGPAQQEAKPYLEYFGKQNRPN